MSIRDLTTYAALVQKGRRIGRAGMSELVIAAVDDWKASGETYKGAMILAGRLKAIATMARPDGYWSEQVNAGFTIETTKAMQEKQLLPESVGPQPTVSSYSPPVVASATSATVR